MSEPVINCSAGFVNLCDLPREIGIYSPVHQKAVTVRRNTCAPENNFSRARMTVDLLRAICDIFTCRVCLDCKDIVNAKLNSCLRFALQSGSRE